MLVTKRDRDKPSNVGSTELEDDTDDEGLSSEAQTDEAEPTSAEQLQEAKLRICQLEFEIKSLRKVMHRDAGRYESQITLLTAESKAAADVHEFEKEMFQAKRKAWEQIESENEVLSQEVDRLRNRLFLAHDELTQLSTETAQDIAALKRHNHTIGLKMADVMKDTLANLEAVYEKQAIDKVNVACRTALQCRGEIQKELDHSQSVMESLLQTFKAQEGKLNRTQLLLALSNDEKEAKAQKEAELRHSLRATARRNQILEHQISESRAAIESLKQELKLKAVVSHSNTRVPKQTNYSTSEVDASKDERCASCGMFLKLIPSANELQVRTVARFKGDRRKLRSKGSRSNSQLDKLGSLGLDAWRQSSSISQPVLTGTGEPLPIWLSPNNNVEDQIGQTMNEDVELDFEACDIANELRDIEEKLEDYSVDIQDLK